MPELYKLKTSYYVNMDIILKRKRLSTRKYLNGINMTNIKVKKREIPSKPLVGIPFMDLDSIKSIKMCKKMFEGQYGY